MFVHVLGSSLWLVVVVADANAAAHHLDLEVEQVHESRLGHGRVSGVVVCGLQKSAKSGAGRDIRHPAPAPGLGGGRQCRCWRAFAS